MAKSRKPSGNHTFSMVPKAEIQRSSFDRSHGVKTTFNAGLLIPVLVDEALPGDTFNVNMAGFARLATPLKPIMDNMYLETFFFAVPMRLVWDNWAKFNGEQVNPGDSTDFAIPQFDESSGVVRGSLHDYMGVPPEVPVKFSALYARAYALIWNEWFRDQNLQDSLVIDTGDAAGSASSFVLQRRGKRHDYFTSALPFPQKGAPVSIPLGTTAPVISNNPTINFTDLTGNIGSLNTGEGSPSANVTLTSAMDGGVLQLGDPSGIVADLSNATAATINSLRQAFQIQRLLERDARGGTRLIEIVKAHFGVTSPDLRATRPQYLGGGSSYVNINPIPQNTQTLETEGTTPQGNLAAMGVSSFNGHGFTQSFTEHCIIIGLACVRADLTYQQGLNRMFSRSTRYDFYWPALSHIGEQEILNKEIYLSGDANDENVFGYQERYAEYRYKPSTITGKFRSSDPQSLDFWHVAQDFASLPTLSADFIQENPPIDRIIAVQSEPHFLFDGHFSMRCARPMPLYGVPGMIDHF